MKRWFLFSIWVLLGFAASLQAQTIVVQVPARELKLSTPVYKFFLPAKKWDKVWHQTPLSTNSPNSLLIFKSPIQHTAIFCRLEDLTLKQFGIMIQVHMGDYNSYMDRKVDK